MIPTMFILPSVLLLSAAGVPGPPSVLAIRAPLHVLVEDAASPFSNKDGTGYANDVVKAAFQQVGVEIVFEVVPYARCKTLVLQGVAPACFSMSWEPGFAGKIRLAESPLFQVTPTYMQNVQRRVPAKSESELGDGVTIGVVNGYEYPASALRAIDRGALYRPTRSEDINLRKLAMGRIDLALVMTNDLEGANFLPATLGLSNVVEPTFSSTRLDSFIGFSTRHDQGIWALNKFNEGMRLIASNGKRQAIWMRWSRKSKIQPDG